MSEVLRFWCYEASNIRCVRESDYDAAQSELAALRSEIDELTKTTSADMFLTLTAEISALREELAATKQALEATRDARDAEQYTSNELRETLSGMNALLADLVNSPNAVLVPLELWKRIHNFVDAASKPTESGASE
ncbi:hypothetical protein D9M71_288430 [compost metagenome]